MAGFGVLMLNIRQQTRDRVEENRHIARLLAASISASVKNGTMDGRPDMIRRLVQDLKSELKDARHLEIYRGNAGTRSFCLRAISGSGWLWSNAVLYGGVFSCIMTTPFG